MAHFQTANFFELKKRKHSNIIEILDGFIFLHIFAFTVHFTLEISERNIEKKKKKPRTHNK